MGRTGIAIATLIILACAIALRVAYVGYDPPHGLSVSRGDYTDEGLKYYQARNHALFGQWRVATPFAMQGTLKPCPVPNLLGAAVFKALGVGRVQARSISIAAGVLSCLILILIGVTRGEPVTGLLAGAFAAVSSVIVSYDRLALFESPMVFFCLAAAFFYLRGGWLRFILTPLFLMLACYTRIHAVAIVGATGLVALAELWRRLSWRRSRKALVLAAVILAVAAAAALVAVLLPSSQIVLNIKIRILSASHFSDYPPLASALDLMVRTFSDSILSLWMPLTLILAALALRAALTRPWKGSTPPPAFMFFWWFAAAFAIVAFLDYRPTRYFALLLPAACWLAADWIVAFANGAISRPRNAARTAAWAVIGVFSGLQIAAVALAFILANRAELPLFFNIDAQGIQRFRTFLETRFLADRYTLGVSGPEAVRLMWTHVANLCLVGAALFILGVAVSSVARRFMRNAAARVRPVAATLLVFLLVASQLLWAFSFFSLNERRRQVADAESSIRALVGNNPRACIGGNWATTLCMGTPYFTFPLARGNGNAWDTFKRFPVTHLLIELDSMDEAPYLFHTYPGEMSRAKLLKIFIIDNYRIGFYECAPLPGAAAPPWPFDHLRESK